MSKQPIVLQPDGANTVRAAEGRCPICDQPAQLGDNPSLLRCTNSKCAANGRLLKFVDGQFHYDPVLSDDDLATSVDPKPPWPAEKKAEAEAEAAKQAKKVTRKTAKKSSK